MKGSVFGAILISAPLLVMAQDLTPPKVEADSSNTASQRAGLSVNEVRVKGRRDSIQVQRQSGTTDYYDEGSLNLETGELGERPALRLWRFGGQTKPAQ